MQCDCVSATSLAQTGTGMVLGEREGSTLGCAASAISQVEIRGAHQGGQHLPWGQGHK